MNILVIGSGGREHAFSWKIAQSKRLGKLYIAPGNPGTAEFGTNLNISPSDFEAIATAIETYSIDMVVVGPEEPLVNGICEFLTEKKNLKDLMIMGPNRQAAALEGSKTFAKQFMVKHEIPTARYKTITIDNLQEGMDFLKILHPPYVLKADGLAAGKGVMILDSRAEADLALMVMLKGKFGDASKTVVIEEFLKGIEVSVFVITDGHNYKILPEAKDYKRVGKGDTGLNTGGMGAVSPVPFANEEFMQKVETRIIKPTINGLQNDGITFKGVVFIGLMNVNGEPYVIEYNVRMGDPETEVVFPRIKSDIIDLFEAVAKNTLDNVDFEVDKRTVTTVMLVSEGYPEEYEKGKIISNLDDTSDCLVFHSGTKEVDRNIVTNGGRVIAVSAYGSDIHEALKNSYRNAEIIQYEKKYFRPDIGFDLV